MSGAEVPMNMAVLLGKKAVTQKLQMTSTVDHQENEFDPENQNNKSTPVQVVNMGPP